MGPGTDENHHAGFSCVLAPIDQKEVAADMAFAVSRP
ncbi:hypothetical protein C8J35_102134 [Rhizobium sp. PP-F2F-G38]|nr:hypothetical protein C8J37_102135 [Rhizobium sp. PP-WC-1G-195]PYE99246.1 hypothetical protein C8J35_102134 [Rhizobium sp. PP-F2F-G38]